MEDNSSFNNNDLKIDTGINMDDFGDFEDTKDEDFDNSSNSNNSSEGREQPENQNDAKGVKRIAIIAGIAGFVIVVIALSIVSIKNANNTAKQQISIEPSTTAESTNTPVNNNNNPTTVQVNDGWIEFIEDNGVSIDTKINSDFTVTSIKHLAKLVNDKNDKMVRSIVKGNVSGLVGTYEIEVPYEKAKYLTVGSVFKITYMCSAENEGKVIGEIKY